MFVYQYPGGAFLSFRLRQSRVKTQKCDIIITVSVSVLGCKENCTYKNSFYQSYHFADNFQLGYGTLPKRAEKNPAESVKVVISRIDRQLRGVERAIQNQPSQEVLSYFRQERLTLELNYDRLRNILCMQQTTVDIFK